MSTIRDNSGTIPSGIDPEDSGTVHTDGGTISSGFGPTHSSTVHGGGPDIISGHGPSPFSGAISLKPSDPLVINSITYQYQGVISKSTGEAEIFLLSRNGKKYVFKLYYPNFKSKTDILKQMKELHHEDIINVLDYGYYQDRFFEIMDYAEGGTLDKYLPIKNVARVKKIVAETVNAYKFCHAHGIIHKDIKPQNLYFKNADGTDLLLGDFGISTLLETGMSRHLTSQSLTIGYAAPEMYGIGGQVYIGKEVDYYALGISLIHIWDGKSPFDGLGIHAISNLTTSGNIHIPGDMPMEVQKLVKGLITVDYTKRWGYDEVQRWLKGEDVPIHFQVQKINYPAYQFSPNKAATTADELADILKNNLAKGRKHLYSGKLSAWVNLFNQGLAVELDRIIEDDYPKDQDVGIQKAIYLLDPDEPLIQHLKQGPGQLQRVECRTAEELSDALETEFEQYTTELAKPDHPFYLYLEAHDAEKEADTFRKYFQTFSAKKALNTIIIELRGREKFKLGGELFFAPEELLKHKNQRFLVRELKDTESGLSLWIEGSEFHEIKQQVEKWRKLNRHDEVTITYALEKGSPFHFPNGDKAYSKSDFIKLFISNIDNRTLFAVEADYWLRNYCGTNYDQIVTEVLRYNYDKTEYHVLISDFMKIGNENYYLDTIASIVEKAYAENKLSNAMYLKHKMFLIKDVEKKVFNKTITDLHRLWSTSLKESDIEKWAEYLSDLAQQLITRIIKKLNKTQLKNLIQLRPPEKGNFIALLNFIQQLLLTIKTDTNVKNISNIHYSNALQIFMEPVQTTLPDQPDTPWYDALDTPHQNIKRLIPHGLFCIAMEDYQPIAKRKVKKTGQTTESQADTDDFKESNDTNGSSKAILGFAAVLLSIFAVGLFFQDDLRGKGQKKDFQINRATNVLPESASIQKSGYTTARVNLRTGPGTGYSSMGILGKNTRAFLMGSKKAKNGEDWYQLKIAEGPLKGKIGYLHYRYFYVGK